MHGKSITDFTEDARFRGKFHAREIVNSVGAIRCDNLKQRTEADLHQLIRGEPTCAAPAICDDPKAHSRSF